MAVATLSSGVSNETYFSSTKKEEHEGSCLKSIAIATVAIGALSYLLLPNCVHQYALESLEAQVGCLTKRCRLEEEFGQVLQNKSVDAFVTFLKLKSISPFSSKFVDKVSSFIHELADKVNCEKVIDAISSFGEIPNKVMNQLFAKEFNLSSLPDTPEELLTGLIATSSLDEAKRILQFLQRLTQKCQSQFNAITSKLIGAYLEKKDYEQIKKLYQLDVNVNTPIAKKLLLYPYYTTMNAWSYAVENDLNLLRILITFSKDINKDVNGLVECGFNSYFYSNTKMTLLALAILKDKKEVAKLLLERGANINYMGEGQLDANDYYASPLAVILRKETTDFLDLLTPSDIPDNLFFISHQQCDYNLLFKGYQHNGDPISVFRAYFNQLELFSYLFALNPKIATFKGKSGLTSLQSAIYSQRFDIAYLHLLASKIREKEDGSFGVIRKDSNTNKTLLHQMVESCTTYVPLFIEDAVEKNYLNDVDIEGNTPIVLALLNHNTKWVQELIKEESIDLERENNNGVSARDLIKESYNPYLKLLLRLKDQA